MNNQHDIRTWEITLLTPLHIGDGEDLQHNLDYIHSNHQIQIIDIDATLQYLSDNPGAISEIGRQGFDLSRFASAYQIPFKPVYSMPLTGQTPKTIRCFVKNAYGQPYIVGSSLKGAVRTALQEGFNRSSLPSPLRFFDFKNAVNGLSGSDPHHDFLRPLQISDSFGVEPQGTLNAEEIKFFNIQTGNTPGWKDFSDRGTKNNYKDADGVYVESLKTGQVLNVKVGIDHMLRTQPIASAYKIPYIQGLDSFESLARAVNAHSRKIAEAERDFFDPFGSPTRPVTDFYKDLISKIDKLSSEPETFIVRMSWGSGWRGMTGNWLKGNDLDIVRREKTLGKAGCPKCKSTSKWDNRLKMHVCQNRNCRYEFPDKEKWLHPVFPKTRRLAMKDGIPCLPPGWVKISTASKDIFASKASGSFPEMIHQKKEDHPIAAKKQTEKLPEVLPAKVEPVKEIWENAFLSYRANDDTITASYQNKKAASRNGKALLPESYLMSLTGKKKKPVKASVEVEAVGNEFRIWKIY